MASLLPPNWFITTAKWLCQDPIGKGSSLVRENLNAWYTEHRHCFTLCGIARSSRISHTDRNSAEHPVSHTQRNSADKRTKGIPEESIQERERERITYAK